MTRRIHTRPSGTVYNAPPEAFALYSSRGPRMNRRAFTKTAALPGVTTALSAGRVMGANDRVRLGFIGLGNRGDQVLDAFLQHKDADVVALCDIHQPYVDFAANKVGSGPQQFKDYRRLLERKDL